MSRLVLEKPFIHKVGKLWYLFYLGKIKCSSPSWEFVRDWYIEWAKTN
jgi:hypothetical protein